MKNELTIDDLGAVRWITLDRPDCKNALTPAIVEAMSRAIRGAQEAR